MLFQSRQRQGQSVMGEYALVFFIAIAAVMSMSLFVRRGIQGRIYDAKTYMVTTVKDGAGLNTISGQYEPYYLNRESTRTATQDSSSGFQRRQISQSLRETTAVTSQSNQ